MKKTKDKIVTQQLSGFMHFVREQGVVGLAVGLVLGTAVKTLVDSIVASIINPIIGLMMGGVNLNDKSVCIGKNYIDGKLICQNNLEYGKVISNMISFIVVAALIYFVVKGLKLDRLDLKTKDKK